MLREKTIILDTEVFLEKEFKISLKAIFGFSYIKLRHLNKVFGTNVNEIYKLSDLNVEDRINISYYLPQLAIFGSALLKKISLEKDKYFSITCYKRNRYLLGFPARGQRTRTNARTSRRLRMKI